MGEMTMAAHYSPLNHKDIEKNTQHIMKQAPNFFIGGDFNCRSPSWGCKTYNKNVRHELISDHLPVVAKNQPSITVNKFLISHFLKQTGNSLKPKWKLNILYYRTKKSTISTKKQNQEKVSEVKKFDDTVIYTKDKKLIYTKIKLQSYISQLEAYWVKWAIKVNPTKSALIIFTKAENVNKEIQILENSQQRNKLLLFKATLRPTMLYGAETWGSAAPTNIQKLHTTQNKIIRPILTAPRGTTTEELHHRANMATIQDRIKHMKKNFCQSIANHKNPAIRALNKYKNSENRTFIT
ncbi:hypothetical protein PR048_019364 [Dryococelus australis]|uniref:Endonuclease/exonuclease/phosphatase domain-containing protein n=1 Tax=Dryococelus australis TaxID=614101 RepID=A0ABQ9H3A9_9NEOP|nr:hypothetical protein PR048_019364 [Dryococelus australis]